VDHILGKCGSALKTLAKRVGLLIVAA